MSAARPRRIYSFSPYASGSAIDTSPWAGQSYATRIPWPSATSDVTSSLVPHSGQRKPSHGKSGSVTSLPCRIARGGQSGLGHHDGAVEVPDRDRHRFDTGSPCNARDSVSELAELRGVDTMALVQAGDHNDLVFQVPRGMEVDDRRIDEESGMSRRSTGGRRRGRQGGAEPLQGERPSNLLRHYHREMFNDFTTILTLVYFLALGGAIVVVIVFIRLMLWATTVLKVIARDREVRLDLFLVGDDDTAA